MKRDLSGWRVLVTGASSGIGRAVAVELLRCGARLVVVARRRERLMTIGNTEKAEESKKMAIVAGDITDPAVRAELLAAAVKHFGGLDAIVSCAGVGARGAFADSDPTVLRRLFEVDFFAPVELWRESLPLLREGRTPLIVSVDSILGYWGIPNMSGYCAAKSALRGIAESLRGELQELGIGLLTVTPGSTATEFHDQALDRRTRPVTAGRLAVTPESVARRIVRSMERGDQRLIPGVVARLAMTLARLFPVTFRCAATRAALRRHSDSPSIWNEK